METTSFLSIIFADQIRRQVKRTWQEGIDDLMTDGPMHPMCRCVAFSIKGINIEPLLKDDYDIRITPSESQEDMGFV